jgi:CRISPR/Cas system-associated exonuclease Cas4 (RecB family)
MRTEKSKMPAAASVTKEVFLKAVTCPTCGWFLLNTPGEPPSPGEQLRMQEGQEVHQRARGLFSEGVFAVSPQQTGVLVASHGVGAVFEAAFSVEGCSARADILQRQNGGFHVMEVKSSLHNENEVAQEHIDDLAYTTMVLRRADVPIRTASLLLLSRDWRLGMDDQALFVVTDRTADVVARADEFAADWADIRDAVVGEKPPPPTPILECKACEYFGSRCIGKGVEYPIFDLPRLRQKKFDELRQLGVMTIPGIPSDFDLTPPQARIRRAVRSGRPVVNKAALKRLLAEVRWPALYLDFETGKLALPVWPDVAPHEQVVTQYSLHICSAPGKVVEHREYLADPSRDCRRELTERLLDDLSGDGSIISYSSFEKTILRGLAQRFPDRADALARCIDRLFDLERVIREGYYHPEFHGRTSIKTTLPVLVPEMSYDGLDVPEGDAAMAAFARMARRECDPMTTMKIRRSLLDYCAQDTLAMVKLHEALERLIA